jgi:acyl-CoA thioester hydrolase
MARVTRHLYRCPLRWADMDAMGHVNNVTYVDYLQEARVDVFRLHAPRPGGEELAEGVVVVRHEVDYLTPLAFRREPVAIDVWVSEVRAASFTLSYEVYDERPDGSRTVYLRARSALTPYVFADERPRRITASERDVLDGLRDDRPGPRSREHRLSRDSGDARRHRYECQVRFSDVDLYRHVNNVKYFEYMQEARIDLLRLEEQQAGEPELSVVVVAVDVEYNRPILLRYDPYPIDTWVEGVGRSSLTLASEVSDGSDVLARARAVVVGFDSVSSQARPLPSWLRERAEARVRRAESLRPGEPAATPT